MLISGYGNRPGIGQAMLQAQMVGNQQAQVDEQEKARKQQLYMGLADLIIKGIPMVASAIAGGAAGGLGGAMGGMAGAGAMSGAQAGSAMMAPRPKRKWMASLYGLGGEQERGW